jgi:hypothetical protein
MLRRIPLLCVLFRGKFTGWPIIRLDMLLDSDVDPYGIGSGFSGVPGSGSESGFVIRIRIAPRTLKSRKK